MRRGSTLSSSDKARSRWRNTHSKSKSTSKMTDGIPWTTPQLRSCFGDKSVILGPDGDMNVDECLLCVKCGIFERVLSIKP